MATVYSDNVVEIAVEHTYGGNPAVNVWHMRWDNETSGATYEDVARDFLDNWQDHVMYIMTNDVVLQGVAWRSLDPTDNTVGTLDPDPAKPVIGQAGGAGMPPNVAFLIKKNTASRPRGRRDGRAFLAGVAEPAVANDGVVVAAYHADYADNLVAFYNGISDTGWDVGGDRYPVVLETTAASRLTRSQNGGVEPPPVTIGSRRVTSITLDTKVATQRDRLR